MEKVRWLVGEDMEAIRAATMISDKKFPKDHFFLTEISSRKSGRLEVMTVMGWRRRWWIGRRCLMRRRRCWFPFPDRWPQTSLVLPYSREWETGDEDTDGSGGDAEEEEDGAGLRRRRRFLTFCPSTSLPSDMGGDGDGGDSDMVGDIRSFNTIGEREGDNARERDGGGEVEEEGTAKTGRKPAASLLQRR